MNIYGAGKSVVLDDDDLQILETPPLQVNQSPIANTQDTTTTPREKKKRAYKQVDPLEAEEKLKIVKNDLSRLYEEYVKNGSHSSNTRHSQQVNSSYGGNNAKMPKSLYVCEEFEEYESQTVCAAGTSELDVYLAEQRLPPSIGFDILAFWKERSRRCPDLAKMACDVLSIPITTVASESAFSIGARVLNKYRSSLKDDTVQALMCARSWLHGFVEYDIDSDEDEDKREVIRQENLGFSDGTNQ